MKKTLVTISFILTTFEIWIPPVEEKLHHMIRVVWEHYPVDTEEIAEISFTVADKPAEIRNWPLPNTNLRALMLPAQSSVGEESLNKL